MRGVRGGVRLWRIASLSDLRAQIASRRVKPEFLSADHIPLRMEISVQR
ncbi:MAG: hypothetical protein JWL81_2311 [Verrucomicrobiales bacterium]|nr:hypothetical protein [Verrucomicrobiales bacterium]